MKSFICKTILFFGAIALMLGTASASEKAPPVKDNDSFKPTFHIVDCTAFIDVYVDDTQNSLLCDWMPGVQFRSVATANGFTQTLNRKERDYWRAQSNGTDKNVLQYLSYSINKYSPGYGCNHEFKIHMKC